MHSASPAEPLLAQIAAAFATDRWPHRAAMQTLLQLCRHPQPAIRETALTLLLHPPVGDEPAYYRRLIESHLIAIPAIRQLPPGLLEALLEILVLVGEIPDRGGMEGFFHRLLQNLPKPALTALLQKPFDLEIFLRQIPVRSIQSLYRRSGAGFKPRWRLLRHALTKREAEPGWSRPTCATLNLLWHPERLSRHYAFRPARWLRVGRLLTLPAGAGFAAMPVCGGCSTRCERQLPAAGKPLAGPFSEATGRYWQTLLAWQAKELLSVRTLAEQVSRDTRRVTLSWHNASLAAAGGWAFPPLRQQFPAESLWRDFKRAVSKHTRSPGGSPAGTSTDPERLWQIWQQRLVLPKIVQAVWQGRVRAAFHSSRHEQWHKIVQQSGDDLPATLFKDTVQGDKYGWPEALSPHQRFPLEQVLAWRRDRHRCWAAGLLRLAALVQEGQRLLDRGDLIQLVVPWIDKFFISSMRAADLEYLPGLVQWLTEQTVRPLILFWDDTARACAPSLQLALQTLRSQGHPFRGIGILGGDSSRRRDASAIISREHGDTLLFALRPRDDTRNPQPLQLLLEHLDYDFFRHYDSSWKDNLCQLYVGTQVFPLLAVQSEREALPAWIAAGGVKYPFGSYVRAHLRDRVVPGETAPRDELDQAYAWWANLG